MLRSDLPRLAALRPLWTAGFVLAMLALAPDASAQRRARPQVPNAPAQAPRAYVTNSSANTVSVIDTSSNLVVATIPVGAGPSRVAISPVGSRAFVANTSADTLSLIDTASNVVVATIPVLDGPASVAVAPDGGRVWVGGSNGMVAVVDVASRAMLTSFSIGAPSPTYSVEGLAIAPDGSKVYALWGSLVVIDATTNLVVNSIYAGNNPTGMALSANGARIVVGAQFGYGPFGFYGTAAIVDTASESVASVVNVWGLPMSIAITPDGSRAFVATPYAWSDTGYGAGYLNSPWVTSIDLATSTLSTGFSVGSPARGLAITPDGARVYVVVPGAGGVKVASTTSNSVVATIPTSSFPNGVAIAP